MLLVSLYRWPCMRWNIIWQQMQTRMEICGATSKGARGHTPSTGSTYRGWGSLKPTRRRGVKWWSSRCGTSFATWKRCMALKSTWWWTWRIMWQHIEKHLTLAQCPSPEPSFRTLFWTPGAHLKPRTSVRRQNVMVRPPPPPPPPPRVSSLFSRLPPLTPWPDHNHTKVCTMVPVLLWSTSLPG